MSGMPTLTDHTQEHLVSRAEFEALRTAQRDGSRYELLAGEVLVTPSPSFTDSELPVAPILAVEILSPSTWRHDQTWTVTAPLDVTLCPADLVR